MHYGKTAFFVVYCDRLSVCTAGISRCAVSYVTYRHISVTELFYLVLCENLGDKTDVLVHFENAVF